MRRPSMPKIPDPIPPAAPPSMAQARTPTPRLGNPFIPPNVRTGARGLTSTAATQKRSLIGG